MNEVIINVVLVFVNLVFVTSAGVWLARHVVHVMGGQIWKRLLVLWGIYLAECFAFSASMGTNVLSFALAVPWGFLFRRWVRSLDEPQAKTLVVRLALYTCLPAVSFLAVFVTLMVSGWPVFTSEGGHRFGIPDVVPWPLCTVAGFFAAVVGSAVVVKTAVTAVIALRRAKEQSAP